jgi:hypothetical protein
MNHRLISLVDYSLAFWDHFVSSSELKSQIFDNLFNFYDSYSKSRAAEKALSLNMSILPYIKAVENRDEKKMTRSLFAARSNKTSVSASAMPSSHSKPRHDYRPVALVKSSEKKKEHYAQTREQAKTSNPRRVQYSSQPRSLPPGAN